MKYVKQFESYKAEKGLNDIIKEAVMQVDDISKVRAIVDIPQSLINNVVKKSKEASGKNIRQFYSDNDIAEEIVKHIVGTYANIDHISTVPFVGGESSQTQPQGQVQPQVQTQPQAQAQPQAQPQAQVQVQTQPQAQMQDQPQAQSQGEMPQAQIQTQSDDDFEEVNDDESQEEEERDELEGDGDEDLPI